MKKLQFSHDSHWFILSGCLLICSTLGQAATVITEPTETSLREAVLRGGYSRFGFSGKVTLSSPLIVDRDTSLDGAGFDVIISGDGKTRIFEVKSNVNLVIRDLKLHNGYFHYTPTIPSGDYTKGGAWGGAIFNDHGFVSATRCSFETNWVMGWNEYHDGGQFSLPTRGGAIFSINGVLALTNCLFSSNLSASSGSVVSGGAIGIEGGSVIIDECVFLTNKIGHVAPLGGGAIALLNSDAAITRCEFRGNAGGRDGWPRPGYLTNGAYAGGAIRAQGGNLVASNCLFLGNAARAVDGTSIPVLPGRGSDAHGGALFLTEGTAVIKNCNFVANLATAGSGFKFWANYIISDYFGGDAKGGAISSSATTLIENCTFNKNSAIGGYAGETYSANYISNFGGTGMGGAIYNTGAITIQNSTFFENAAVGGNINSWTGQPGGAKGGSIFNENGEVSAVHITVHQNAVKSGIWENGGHSVFAPNHGPTEGAAIYMTNGTFSLLHSIVSFGRGASNVFGSVEDLGGNLSSDDSAGFTNSTSGSAIDPRLGAFASYGSMTPTVSLLPGSPARDIILNSACLDADQRGRPRPYGLGCDSGASESQPPYFLSGYVRGGTSLAQVEAGPATAFVGINGSFEFANLQPGPIEVSTSAPNLVFVPLPFLLDIQGDVGDLEFRAYPRNLLALERISSGSLRLVYGGIPNQSVQIEKSADFQKWDSFLMTQLDRTGGLWSEVSTNETRLFFRLKLE